MKLDQYLLSLFIFITACGKGQFTAIGDVGEDPFFPYAWHIQNSGQRFFDQGKGISGFDIHAANAYRQGLSGKGVHILISDTGVDYTHPDLAKNHSYGLSMNFGSCLNQLSQNISSTCFEDNNQYAPPLQLNEGNTLNSSLENEAHGTEVAGVIAALEKNQIGSRGIAPHATISSSNFLSSGFINNASLGLRSIAELNQMSPRFDIINQSWGKSSNQEINTLSDEMKKAITDMITEGRNEKGTILVRAAGNYNQAEDQGANVSAIFEAFNNTPYSINVGALDARGLAAWYSLPGANLWISAPGGDDQIAGLITTDISGCINGKSNKVTNLDEKTDFQIGKFGNGNCDYTNSFIGTSAAAPVVSGAIALILEKYPNLSWREVKFILAASATKVDPQHEGWLTNAAGLHFHHKYGFGAINVDEAIKQAATISEYNFLTGEIMTDETELKDLSLNNYYNTNDFYSFSVSSEIPVFSVQLMIDTDDYSNSALCDVKELQISITSPSNTTSILTNGTEALASTNYSNTVLLTNHFFQEPSQGVWKVKVSDTNQSNSTKCKLNKLSLIIGL